MLIVTTDSLPGYEIRYVRGAVSGAGVQPVSAGLSPARREAIEKLKADAERYGCNAVIGLRFENCALGNGQVEVYAYGTGVQADQLGADQQRQEQSAPVMPSVPSNPSGGIPMVGRNLTVQVPGR